MKVKKIQQLCVMCKHQELKDFRIWIDIIFNTTTTNLIIAAMIYYHERAVDKETFVFIVNLKVTVSRYVIIKLNTAHGIRFL